METDIFVIESRHVIALGIIFALSCIFLVPSSHSHYTYMDRALSWICGVILGLVVGLLVL